jgi:hypothetical protein
VGHGCAPWSRLDLPMNEPHRARRGHDFWPPAEVVAAIPALYVTDEVGERDKIVHLHYFVGA